jgi:hypothetical protein
VKDTTQLVDRIYAQQRTKPVDPQALVHSVWGVSTFEKYSFDAKTKKDVVKNLEELVATLPKTPASLSRLWTQFWLQSLANARETHIFLDSSYNVSLSLISFYLLLLYINRLFTYPSSCEQSLGYEPSTLKKVANSPRWRMAFCMFSSAMLASKSI